MTAPARRLSRKLVREGVMGLLKVNKLTNHKVYRIPCGIYREAIALKPLSTAERRA